LISPKIPQRFYYKFGKPITTEGLYKTGFSKNDDDVQAMYETVKSELEDNIEYLLRRRADDPFKVPRCSLTLSKPVLKAPMLSALESRIW